MIANILTWLLFAGLAVLFAWLVRRAWRSPLWYVKWPGVVLGSLVSLLLVVILVVGLRGIWALYRSHGKAPELTVEVTPERVQRGQYLADAFCASCHSPNGSLPLTGGLDLANDIPLPIGSMVSANLTPAGALKDMTDGQIYRVLREGIGPDGRLLAIMSSARARYLSEEDLYAVIAYLRSQPAGGELTPNPPDRINYLGALLTGAGMIQPLPPVTEAIVAPPKAADVHYGKYLISFQDCMVCHGDNLTGGTSSLGPKGPGLRQVKGWTQEQFITAMRTGVNPNGIQLKPPMPWQFIGRLDDTDLAALYQYIISLE